MYVEREISFSHRLVRTEAMADANQTNNQMVPQAEAEPPMKLKATYMPTWMGMNSCIVMPERFRKIHSPALA